MFSHIMIGSNDIARSKRFYNALFSAIGGKPGAQDPKGRLVYTHRVGRFRVTKPIDGQPATDANGGTIGFTAENSAEVDAWHKAGVSTRMRSFVPFLVAAAVIAFLPALKGHRDGRLWRCVPGRRWYTNAARRRARTKSCSSTARRRADLRGKGSIFRDLLRPLSGAPESIPTHGRA